MFLEIFAKETLVGKAHEFGNFFDAHGAVLKQDTDFEGYIVIDPFVGRALAHLLHRLGKIFGGDAQLFSIPTHTTLRAEVLFQKRNELGEDTLGTCVLFGGEVLYLVDGVADVINHRGHQRADHIAAEMVVLLIQFLLDELAVVGE